MNSDELVSQINRALQLAQDRVRRLIEKNPGLSPLFTVGGHWKHSKPAWTSWCDGFLPGMMWLFLQSKVADDPIYWRKMAEKHSAEVEKRKDDRDVHTLGFVFYHGAYKRWYDATVQEGKPNQAIHDVLIHAARVLSQRYHADGHYLRAFLGNDSMLIDAVMNVPLLFYAGEEVGDVKLIEAATNVAITVQRTLVRGDGSTAQQGLFNIRTGEFLRQATQQGYRGDSCWSRGLAWSLYGFSMCHELSHDARFLETADLNARYFLRNATKGGVPPWDHDAPETGTMPRTQPDSSAAAIAAGGFLRLAKLMGNPNLAALYKKTALEILSTLVKPPYLASEEPEWDGILKRAVHHMNQGLGVNESVLWGDFYFVEAMVLGLEVLKEPGSNQAS